MASFNIGKFRTLETGDLIGAMSTATVRMNGVRFIKLRKTKESQPDFRVISQGGAEMGACWEKASKDDGLVYLSGYFDAPELPNQVNFAMFEIDGTGEHVMTWSRPKPKTDNETTTEIGDFGSATDDEPADADFSNDGANEAFGEAA